jgi:hypothetical protein
VTRDDDEELSPFMRSFGDEEDGEEITTTFRVMDLSSAISVAMVEENIVHQTLVYPGSNSMDDELDSDHDHNHMVAMMTSPHPSTGMVDLDPHVSTESITSIGSHTT